MKTLPPQAVGFSASIQVRVLDALRTLRTEVWDEDGNVVRHLYPEEYEAERARREGRIFLHCILLVNTTDGTMRTALESPMILPEQFHETLPTVFEAAGKSLSTLFKTHFPDETKPIA